MLDEQAKVAYRRRLFELREELEEAKEQGNVERAEQAEQEIDTLTRELSRAVGLGGRNRRSASASERARQRISKTMKLVLDRIERNDAALLGTSSRAASRSATSAPTSLTPISRSRGNSLRQSQFQTQTRLSSQRSSRPQVGIPLQALPIIPSRCRCWKFLHSRWRNEPLLWGGNRNAAPFARSSIARAPATDRLSCSTMDLAWAKPGWPWRPRSTRRAMASAARSGTATKETNLVRTSRSPRSSRIISRRRRVSKSTGGKWAPTRQNWLR